MNIVRENLENQSELLKVTVTPADYGQAVENALKNYRKKADMPGFRKGMVPMSVIHKMYRKGVTAEEAYRAASNAAFKHLEDNGVKTLGDMMPSDSQPELDFENGTDFEFRFEIGLAPEVNLPLSKKDKVEKLTIAVDDKMREGYKNNYLRRFGKLEDVERAESDEALSVTLTQPDGLTVEDAYVGLIGMSEEERRPFLGKKAGDTLQVNVNELYKTPSQRASVLGVKENELEGINPEFTLTVNRIRKFVNPELNEAFFKEAFPAGDVTDAQQFDAKIEAQITADLEREAGYKFIDDVRRLAVEKAGLTLPEPFLKKWLYAVNEGKFTAEAIEKEFPSFAEAMKWDLIKRHFTETEKLEVSEADARTEAKALAMMQFSYYGMHSVADDMLENYANSMLGNKEEARKIYDRLYERKVTDAIAGMVTVKEKTVTAEEFQQISAAAAAARQQ